MPPWRRSDCVGPRVSGVRGLASRQKDIAMSTTSVFSPVNPHWVVYRRAGKVFARQTLSVPELRKFLADHSGSIVKVCDTMRQAIEARHDAQLRCSGCQGGKGRYACDACASAALIDGLSASVAVASAQNSLRKVFGSGIAADAERDTAGGSMAALARRFAR